MQRFYAVFVNETENLSSYFLCKYVLSYNFESVILHPLYDWYTLDMQRLLLFYGLSLNYVQGFTYT